MGDLAGCRGNEEDQRCQETEGCKRMCHENKGIEKNEEGPATHLLKDGATGPKLPGQMDGLMEEDSRSLGPQASIQQIHSCWEVLDVGLQMCGASWNGL